MNTTVVPIVKLKKTRKQIKFFRRTTVKSNGLQLSLEKLLQNTRDFPGNKIRCDYVGRKQLTKIQAVHKNLDAKTI